jgi:hypothetical protein
MTAVDIAILLFVALLVIFVVVRLLNTIWPIIVVPVVVYLILRFQFGL